MAQSRGRAALLGWIAVLLAAPVWAQAPGEIPLADVLQILVLDREVLAVDAAGGGQTREALELGETVLWDVTRGRVGVVVTDRRILAVATTSAAWQEARFRRKEQMPAGAELGDRVAVLVTNLRVLGFDGGSGNLVETRLGPKERTVGTAVGANAAVVLTTRRGLGLSPFRGGFFEVDLGLGDRVESMDADANLVTVTTSRRLLTFRAPTGTWEERRRNLR